MPLIVFCRSDLFELLSLYPVSSFCFLRGHPCLASQSQPVRLYFCSYFESLRVSIRSTDAGRAERQRHSGLGGIQMYASYFRPMTVASNQAN